MNDRAFIADYAAYFVQVMQPDDLAQQLCAARDALVATRDRDRMVLLAGNGASASIASHYALDFTKQAGIRAMAFNDATLVTAYGNDYGYERWVERALGHYCQSGDTAVLISTSGSSANLVNAADQCRAMGVTSVTLTGFESSNPLRTRGDINLWADSRAYNVVEAVHTLWLGMLCDLVIGCREYGVKG